MPIEKPASAVTRLSAWTRPESASTLYRVRSPTRGSPSVAIQTARWVPVSSQRASQSWTWPEASGTGSIVPSRMSAGDADGEADAETKVEAEDEAELEVEDEDEDEDEDEATEDNDVVPPAVAAPSVVIGAVGGALLDSAGELGEALGDSGAAVDDGEPDGSDGDGMGVGLAAPAMKPVHVPSTSRPSAGSISVPASFSWSEPSQ